MDNSTKFWLTLLFLALIPGNYILYKTLVDFKHANSRATYCGVVVKKGSDEVAIKHGSRTDLYLVINYDELGQRATECGPNTYYTTDVGDRVCFSLRNYDVGKHRELPVWYDMLSLIVGFVDAIIILLGVIFGVQLINELLDGR